MPAVLSFTISSENIFVTKPGIGRVFYAWKTALWHSYSLKVESSLAALFLLAKLVPAS